MIALRRRAAGARRLLRCSLVMLGAAAACIPLGLWLDKNVPAQADLAQVLMIAGMVALLGGVFGFIESDVRLEMGSAWMFQEEAKRSSRSFILILRSFKNSVTWTSNRRIGTLVVNGWPILAEIGSALEPYGIPVALGTDTTVPEAQSNLFLEVDDAAWLDVVGSAARMARAIVIVPEGTGGISLELALVATTGLWEKTVIVMPPAAFDEDETRTAWRGFQMALAERNCRLPDYVSSGLLFRPNEDLSIRKSCALSYGQFGPSGLDIALRELMPPDGGRPTCEIVRDFEARGDVRAGAVHLRAQRIMRGTLVHP
jgi:hypothetical protein